MKTIILSMAFAALTTNVFATTPAPWEGFSDPDILSSGYKANLNSLPKEGAMNYDPRAWSGHWWPSKEGGINNRWNSTTREGFGYRSFSKTELLKLTTEQISALSPTEKFDIAFQRYNYPLKKEVGMTVSPTASDWDGICHGWAPASVNHDEPVAFSVKNNDGIQVTFGSSDIKALLSYGYASNIDNANERHMGLRCNFGRWTGGNKECDQDLNAGAFHLILTNELGINQRSFVADLDRYEQVWNQPIAGYRVNSISKPRRPSAGAAASAVSEVTVKVKVYYVEGSEPLMFPVMGTVKQTFNATDYEYALELNSQGNIVGGTWISTNRPDFVWRKAKINTFGGALKGLETLVKMGEDVATRYPRQTRYSVFDMNPARPINCAVQDAPYVNANSELRKLEETNETVSFQMSFQFGNCAGGKYNTYALPNWAMFASIRDAAIMPWQRDYVSSEEVGRTNTDLQVKVTFQKNKLFKNGKSEASFTFYFYPNGMNPGSMYFPWLATLSEVPMSGIGLKLTQLK